MDDKTVMSIKIDKKLKERAQKLAKELGVPLTTVINAQLAQFVRDKELTISKGLQPSPYLEKIIKEFESDREKGKNTAGPFESAEEMFADIENELDRQNL